MTANAGVAGLAIMTEPVAVAVAVLAAILWATASWLNRPSAPDFDAERWFKVLLATVLRGEVEAAGGDAGAWEARVKAVVPYHPLCRDADRLLGNPSAGVPVGAPRPGERPLIDALAALPAGRARWARLFETDASLDALLEDPAELGPAYDPARAIGPGMDWEAVAAIGTGDRRLVEALTRRLAARWLLIDGPGVAASPIDALASALGAAATIVQWTPDDLGRTLAAHVPNASDRAVVVAVGDAVPWLMRALLAEPTLRDRTLAVLSIGGVVRGWPGRPGVTGEASQTEWLEGKFRPDVLDTERARATPWIAMQWADPDAEAPSAAGLPVASQRFPVVADVAAVSAIDVVDLGVLPSTAPPGPVSAALITITGLLALTAGR